MNVSKQSRFLFLSLVFLVGSYIVYGQYAKDPQWLLYQKNVQAQMEKSGYASARIDSLHQRIAKSLPSLASYVKKDEQDGEYKISLTVARGETMELPKRRYLYTAELLLFTDQQGSKLNKVQIRFVKHDITGDYFNTEVRILENPTPNFDENLESLDRNDDMILSYYELVQDKIYAPPKENIYNSHPTEETQSEKTFSFPETPTEELRLVKQATFPNIAQFEKRMLVVDAYLEYLARGQAQVARKEYSLNLSESYLIHKILQLD